MVHKDLVVVTGLDIARLSPLGTEVHIQQVGGTIDVESACGNAILGIVGGIGLGLASTGHDEEHMFFAEFLFEVVDEFPEFTVQTLVGIFQFRLTICHRLILIEPGIVGQTEQVRDAVRTQCEVGDALQGEFCNVRIYQCRTEILSIAVFTFHHMLEGSSSLWGVKRSPNVLS